MEKALVIMAAGIGSRYGGLKQMDPVGPNGEFIIDYSVYDAIRAGFNKVVFIIRHDIEKDFKASIGNRVSKRIDTDYTFQKLDDLPEGFEVNLERTKPWGTTQAVLTCENIVRQPFAVINADDFYGEESYRVLSQYLETISGQEVNACMVGFQLGHTLSKYGSVTRGICQSDENDILKKIVETQGVGYEGDEIICEDDTTGKKTLKSNDLASMNMWGFHPVLFEAFKEDFSIFLNSLVNELKDELIIPTTVNVLITKAQATVKVLSTSSDWFGVTYPQDKSDVVKSIAELIQAGRYPPDLWG